MVLKSVYLATIEVTEWVCELVLVILVVIAWLVELILVLIAGSR